jgi:hypothetical protein
MPDMRKTFRWIQQRYGHNVYLQRRDLYAAEDGVYRFKENEGYKEHLEQYTVRSRFPGANNSGLARTRNEVDEGVITEVDMIFYFQWDADPKEGDRIYVKDPRYNSPNASDGHELYKIDYAVANRGLGGRIEYWAVGATRESPN